MENDNTSISTSVLLEVQRLLLAPSILCKGSSSSDHLKTMIEIVLDFQGGFFAPHPPILAT